MKKFIQLQEDCFDLLKNFDALNKMVEKLFDDKKQENIDRDNERFENETEANKELYQAITSLNNFNLSEELAPAARYGLCVSLNSIIESSMYEICNFIYELKLESEIDNTKTLEKRIKKIKDSDGKNPSNIKKHGLYLEQELNIKLPRFFEKDLPLINLVRNIITHKNGLLTEEDKTALIDLLSNFEENKTGMDPYYKSVRSGVIINTDSYDRNYIFLNKLYLQGVLGKVKCMFVELFEKINKHTP